MNSKLLSLIFACSMMTAVSAVAQEVENDLENAADQVEETAEEAVDDADAALEEAGDEIDEAATDVEDQARETTDDVSDQVEETTGETKEEVNDAAEEVDEEIDEETDTPNEQAMLMPTASDDNAQNTEADKNIVELAQSQEDLSTLVEALKAADLVSTLEGDGPFTVFAPNNAAFEALPAGTLEELLKPENKDKLTEVLTFHVVPEKAMSSDLSDGQKVATVEGEDVNVMLQDGNVMVDGAKVVQPDVEASNGVVHIIDAVILPPSMTETDVAQSDEEKEEGQY